MISSEVVRNFRFRSAIAYILIICAFAFFGVMLISAQSLLWPLAIVCFGVALFFIHNYHALFALSEEDIKEILERRGYKSFRG